MIELKKIDEKYLTEHPDAESLFTYLGLYAPKDLIGIYNEAKGRKIVFTYDSENIDDLKYTFE